jgi:hypothetical protein
VALAELNAGGDRWRVNVVYGDHAIAALLTNTELDTKPRRVPVAGLVTIVTDSLGDDQNASRRVIEGTPEGRQITRSAVEAVMLLKAGALLVVDQLASTPGWQESMTYAMERCEEAADATAPALIGNPGEDAANAVRLLNARTAKGLPRERGEGL